MFGRLKSPNNINWLMAETGTNGEKETQFVIASVGSGGKYTMQIIVD